MKGKRRAIIALLAALCMSTAVAGLAGCGGGKDPHTHIDADNNGVCDECNEPLRYVVSFDTNGGNALPKQGVAIGGKATKPSDPVRDGFAFDGWFKEDGTAFDFDAEITGNITAYAHWTDAAATADTYFDFEEVDGGVSVAAKAGQTLPQDVVLPATYNGKAVVAIKSSAFEQQPALRAVKIPASIKSIGQYAFRNCTSLRTVNGGENLEEVGYGVFTNTAWDLGLSVGEVYLGKTLYKYAGSLYADTQITVKDGTVGISAGAFENLEHLVGITIPESVKTIGSRAFAGTGLLSVSVKAEDAPKLGNSILGAVADFTGRIYVPASSVASYKAMTGWKNYADKIYAEGTADQTFVVTFSAVGAGNVPQAQSVKGFEKASAPTTPPTMDELEFDGWFLDEDCTLPFDFASEITENLTLYAKFGKYYRVTFTTDDDASAVAQQRIEAGEKVTEPLAPTKDGNEFMGWFLDEACTKKFDFDARITEDVTLYAKFLPNGVNYTGTGDYEGWVIENGRVKEYTGSLTEIKIPKELTRLDSIAEIVPAPRSFSTSRSGNLLNIASIEVDSENDYFKVENNALMSKDGSVLYFQIAMQRNEDLQHTDVVKVAPYAFYKCALTQANMTSVLDLGDELEEVGDYAFFGSRFTDFTPFKAVKTIGDYAFFDSSFTSIESAARHIGAYAFGASKNGYVKLCTKLVLHDIVTVGDYAFGMYANLYDGKYSWYGYGAFKSIVIGPYAETLGRNAFGWSYTGAEGSCRVIFEGDSVHNPLPDPFYSLGSSQQGRWLNLFVKESIFSDFIKEPGYLKYHKGFYTDDGWFVMQDGTLEAYEGRYEQVTIPAGLTEIEDILDIFGTAENFETCTSLSVANGNEAFKVQDGALLSADGTVLYGYFGDGTGNFANVTEIKPYAFYNRLKASAAVAAAADGLTFGKPETVGKYAFYGCDALTDFAPFSGLRIITEHSFDGTGLTQITFSDEILASIEDGAFANCANLASVHVKLLTQPKIGRDVFGETVAILVPYEYADTFMRAWALYIEQVQADETTHAYTVTFDTDAENGGTEVESQLLLSGGKATKPETDPKKAGYFFDGWYTQDGSEGGNWGAEFNFDAAIDKQTTVYAKWTQGLTVTFDTGDGSDVDAQCIYPNKLAERPADPTRDGYVFGGWYRDAQCFAGQEFDFAKDAVAEDLTLHAKWTEGWTVNFDTGKGSAVDKQVVLKDGKASRPEDPTRLGYKFAGWYKTDGTVSGEWGDEYTFADAVTGDITLHAKWTEDFWDLDENGKLLHYYGTYDKIIIPAELKSIDSIMDIFGDTSNLAFCTSVEVAQASTSFKVVNNALLSYDGSVLYAFFGSEETTLTWSTVTEIGAYAFHMHLNEDLKLVFSADLATIGAHAFEGTAISSFEAFENVKTIGEYAFVGTALVDVTWNTDGEIPSDVFIDIETLTTLTFMNATSIGAWAFSGDTHITTITLGANLKKIGEGAFWEAGQADSIKDIWLYSIVPPTIEMGISGTSSNTHPLGGDRDYGNWKPHFKAHVMYGSLSTYKSISTNGWNWYNGGSGNPDNIIAWTVNVTLHMGEAEGNVSAPDVTGYFNTALTAPVPGAWEGKAFIGWYTDNTLQTEFNFKQALKGDVELWAKWANGVNVTFSVGDDATGGSTVSVVQNGKVTKPADPTKAGYFFEGWYTKNGTLEGNDWGDLFDFETSITQATTVYAKWTKGVNVSFDLDGSSTTGINAQTVYPGKGATKPTRTPTKTGYTFEGWYLKTDGDEFDAEAVDFETAVFDKDTTIYAKWTKNWSVTFDLDSGSITGPSASAQSVYPGATATKPTKTPTKTGYTFEGWYLKTGDDFAAEAFDFETPITADTTIYAKWTKNWSVTFDLDSGTGTAAEQSIYPGKTATKPADPKKTGYFFDGWYLKTGDNFAADAFDFKTPITADTTIHAKWTQGVKVTFSTGEDATTVAEQTVYPGKTATKPAADPTKAGWFFDGWYKEEACTNVFDFETETISQETTVYAKWTQGITISYNTGESEAEVESEIIYPGKTAQEPATAPEWLGHIFEGWYTRSGAEGDWGELVNFAEKTFSTDTTLYAKWSDGWTVTFKSDTDTTFASQTVAKNGTATRPANDPAKQGYLFLGWYTQDGTQNEDDWGTKFNFSTAIDGNKTLYARWMENFWEVDVDGKLVKYYGPTDVAIEIPANVKTIASILDIYGAKANLTNAQLTVSPMNKSFKIVNHALLSADETVLYFYLGGASALEWKNVTKIGDYAFYGKLTDSTPFGFGTIESIGKGAFENCTGITSFEPFKDIEDIGADAFNNTKLTEVVWNTSGTVTAAFNNITTLKTVVLMNATSIAANAFKGCSIVTAVIGPNVKSIGSNAFATSAKTLTSLTVYAATPPTMNTNGHPLGGETHKKVGKIYVPRTSVDLYLKATAWNWYDHNGGNLYTPITVNVTMHMGEGQDVPEAPEVNAYWNEKMAAPVPAHWKGKVFDGWYTDATFAQRFNFNQKLTEDIEIWAKWSDGYYVEFESNGGTDVEWIPVKKGGTINEPEAPYLLGSRFVGWYTQDGTTSQAWGEEFDFDAPIDANIKLYAKWDKGYAVRFDLGYETTTTIEGQTIMPDDADKHVKKPTDPTRTNCVFEGWYTKNGAEGDWGAKFNFEETEISADTTLYAKWNPWVVNADGSLKAYGGDKKNIEIPLNVTSIPNICVLFGSSFSSIPSNFTGYSITVAANHTAFKIVNNMLLDINGKICYLYFGSAATVDLTGITEIKPYAFYSKSYVTSATMTNVETIGTYAFYGCGFTSITLDAVKTIESYAFNRCSTLSTIVIGKDCTSIGAQAFNSCIVSSAGGSFTIKATTPPTFGNRVFGTSTFKGKIYVPSENLDAYKKASGWSGIPAAQFEAITE